MEPRNISMNTYYCTTSFYLTAGLGSNTSNMFIFIMNLVSQTLLSYIHLHSLLGNTFGCGYQRHKYMCVWLFIS